MLKSISFIVLTEFFQFNELKISKQPGYFIFFSYTNNIFFTVYMLCIKGNRFLDQLDQFTVYCDFAK